MARYFLPFFLLVAGIVSFLTLKQVFITNNQWQASGVSNYTGAFEKDNLTADYYGKTLSVPQSVFAGNFSDNSILGVASPGERWIEVDLSEQKLRAWDGDTMFLETLVSTGLPWWKTPTGEFRIWIKLRATKMEGGSGKYYYNLPNVPYVMFFGNDEVPNWRGFGLHGTYWHNDFGTPHSHGCVNLPTSMAEQLYYWTSPTIPSGKSVTYASAENPGTRIVIHE